MAREARLDRIIAVLRLGVRVMRLLSDGIYPIVGFFFGQWKRF